MIYLNKIGLEIEGEWSADMVQKLEEHDAIHEVKHDGSIRDCSGVIHDDMYKREVTTIPLHVNGEDADMLDGLFSLLSTAYEAGEFHFNKTCGFHVHTSYIDEDGNTVLPDTLASSPFYVDFAQAVKAKYPKVYEARKDNQYCRLSSNGEEGIAVEADIQSSNVMSGEGSTTRYRFINVEAYRKYGTIEFRFFPASKPDTMREYLEFIKAQVNAWVNRETLRAECSAVIPEAEVCELGTDVVTKLERNQFTEGVPYMRTWHERAEAEAKPRRLSIRRLHASITPLAQAITIPSHV